MRDFLTFARACIGACLIGTVAPSVCAQPDLIVAEIDGVEALGATDSIESFSIGTQACNLGLVVGETINWWVSTNQHPVTTQNLFVYDGTRFRHIGQGFAYHHVCALSINLCGVCFPTGCGTLGPGCSTPTSATAAANQARLGPKSDIDAATGSFSMPYTSQGVTGATEFKRVQVDAAELGVVGAKYFVSSHYLTADEAQFGMHLNNESYRELTINATLNTAFVQPTRRERYAVEAWAECDPGVQISIVDVPGDGRFIVAGRATEIGPDLWQYEYAVQNYNSSRSCGGVDVPIPNTATVGGAGFHDVDSHSGEPYDPTDWSVQVDPDRVQWRSPNPFAVDPDSNALRWDTIYNFWFESSEPPAAGSIRLELFTPGSPDEMIVPLVTPGGTGIVDLPANDLCQDAITLSDGLATFSTRNATTDGPAHTLCFGPIDPQIQGDIWFQYDPQCDGVVTARICDADFPVRIAAYSGTCGSIGSVLACSEVSTCLSGAEITFPVLNSGTVLLRIGSADVNLPGVASLELIGPSCQTEIPNDDCANAQPIFGTGNFAFDSSDATNDGENNNGACEEFGEPGIELDLWYCWTSDRDSEVILSTCGLTAIDSKIAIYDGCSPCPEGLGLIECNDDWCDLQSQIVFQATTGHQYLIRVGSFPGAPGGPGRIGIRFNAPPMPPPNDACANATPVVDGTIAFTTDLATTDGPAELTCENAGDAQLSNDIWFHYTAMCDGVLNISTCGSGFDTKLAVYSQDCPGSGGTLLECNDDSCGLQSSVTVNMTAAQEFLIRVGGFDGDAGTGSIEVSGSNCAPPANDACEQAASFNSSSIAFDTRTATTDGPPLTGGTLANIQRDVWFSWTAPGDGIATFDTCSQTAFDSAIAIYNGDGCLELASRLAAVNNDDCGEQSRVSVPVSPGDDLMIRVGAPVDLGGPGILRVELAVVTCICEYLPDGMINSDDFFAFLDDFFGGVPADVNGDGLTNSQDFFDFLGCFFDPGDGC